MPQGNGVFPLRNRPQNAKCGDRKHTASSRLSEVMASVAIPASASWVTDLCLLSVADMVRHDSPSIQYIYCFLEDSTQSSVYYLKWHLSSAFSRLLQCSVGCQLHSSAVIWYDQWIAWPELQAHISFARKWVPLSSRMLHGIPCWRIKYSVILWLMTLWPCR